MLAEGGEAEVEETSAATGSFPRPRAPLPVPSACARSKVCACRPGFPVRVFFSPLFSDSASKPSNSRPGHHETVKVPSIATVLVVRH